MCSYSYIEDVARFSTTEKALGSCSRTYTGYADHLGLYADGIPRSHYLGRFPQAFTISS